MLRREFVRPYLTAVIGAPFTTQANVKAEDAPEGLVEVGKREKDACQKKNTVTVFGKKKDGVEVKAGESLYMRWML